MSIKPLLPALPLILGSLVSAVDDPASPPSPEASDGRGNVTLLGERKQWHKLTLCLEGPFAREGDTTPNPFTDLDFRVEFRHASGEPRYLVPGHFAADGNASDSSAEAGTIWRAHLSPDKVGEWHYRVHFKHGSGVALGGRGEPLAPFDGITGSFEVAASDKQAPDFRARGRLTYVGRHHLRFAGDGSWFLKAGADAPETLFGYADFDGTIAGKPDKVPLKRFEPHLRDWREGDPSWKDGRGKGLIGALNYLASEGMNAFSFIPYNAGGDGDCTWPFVRREDPLHYDCSKLDQWGIVLDHATARGLFIHFKLQETENDDRKGPGADQSLDGGDLGPERKLYLRELISRFGHNLALNWNLGEENTQSTRQQQDMARWIRQLDPYGHPVVLHTYPEQQQTVYRPHLGKDSVLDGLSLQNSDVRDCHHQVVGWLEQSARNGKAWVVCFDEPGDASFGTPPDDTYPGMRAIRRTPAGKKAPSVDDARRYVLWGTLMAGGGGVEYYFGYRFPENDLRAENWRSRKGTWNDARRALEFFRDQKIPFQDMHNRDDLVGNPAHDNSRYCLAKEGECYLVYLPDGGSTEIQLPGNDFRIAWFNPRDGRLGEAVPVRPGAVTAPDGNDWLAVIRR